MVVPPNWQQRRAEVLSRLARFTSPTNLAISADNETSSLLRDLDQLLEELQVAEEELRAQQAELLEANAALEVERSRYRELFDLAPDGYVVLDLSGNVVEANQAMLAILQRRSEAVTDARLALFVPIDHRIRFANALSATIRDGEMRALDLSISQESGAIVPIQARFTAIRGRGGAVSGIRCLVRDTTEQRLQDEQLRRSLAQAHASQEAKSRFLANMSHEIRTPMNGVIGIAGLLAETELSPQQQELVDIITSSGESLLHLINEILDLSRVESGRLELEVTRFDLRSTIRDVQQLLAAQAKAQGLELRVNYPEGAPTCFIGDRGRIRQVVINLVGNAIKFTEAGHVEIAVECTPERGSDSPPPPGAFSKPRQRLRISVADTGVGIPEDARSRVWNEFDQGDSSTTRKHGGAGLGLAISQRLVEAMGGEISFDSQVGVGTTFHVVLELPSAESIDRFEEPIGERASRFAVKVLVAEDNATNRVVARVLLVKLGCDVELVENGFEALERLEQGRYDLVLMDCQMPRLDGYEATRRLRLLEPPGRHTTVVAMTANAMPGDREKCLHAGMDDVVTKPITLDRLRAMLQRNAA